MLTGAAAFLLLLIALLAIPLTLTFQVSWQQAFESDIELQWAFGLVRIRSRSSRAAAPTPEGEKREPGVGRGKRAPGKRQNFFAVVRHTEFRRRIIRFISDMWRAVHKKEVSARVRVGLGDPADTGQLWAIVGPMAGMLANVQAASIDIEPDFLDATLDLDSSGSVRIIPLHMIYLGAALLLSPAVWQGIRQMRTEDQ